MEWRKEEGFDKILNDIRLKCHSIIQIFTSHGFPSIPFLREGRVTLCTCSMLLPSNLYTIWVPRRPALQSLEFVIL